MAQLSFRPLRCRTMWEASRDLLEAGDRKRCAETWGRGYVLWMHACRMRAQGEPFTLTSYLAKWMP